MIDSKIITTNAPIGQGVAPSNAIFYTTHMDCFTVDWQLDDRGWATSYYLEVKPEVAEIISALSKAYEK